MSFYRLKSGSHSTGVGNDQKFYLWNDSAAERSDGNIVESDQDLAKADPARWELTEQVPPKRGIREGEEPPAPPPTDLEMAEAEMTRAEAHAPRRPESAPKHQKTEAESDPPRHAQEGEEESKASQEEKAESKAAQEAKQKQQEKAKEEDAKLERMSVQQLKEVTEREEIEVKGNATKEHLIQTIRQARQARPRR